MSGEARFLKLSEAPQFRESTWGLIERHFPQGEIPLDRDSIENEFSLLLNSANESRVWICVTNDQVVATSSWRPFEAHIPGRSNTIKCAGIGLVVTDPGHRKKGFAASLQKHIEDSATKEGALLSLLWSDLHDFYMKQGFLPAGTEYMWSIPKKEIKAPTDHPNFNVTKLTDISEIAPLYEAQKHGPQRDWNLYNTLLQLSDTYGWVAKDTQSHKPIAYALMGKARDLRNTLHELIGDAKAVPSLLYQMGTCLESKSTEMRVQIPADSPLKTTISDSYGPPELSALSYMKILSTAGTCQWINENNTLPSGMSLEADESGFVLRKGKSIVWDSPDEGHLLQLFFGPWKPAALSIPKSLKTQLAETNTIGIYFWGFDSV
jgi:GNAT superfamily N-acetyltransferase